MKHTHIIFSIIWLITAFVFGYLSYESYNAKSTNLPEFISRIPDKPGVMYYNNINMTDFFNSMVEINNKNTKTLENSIRHTAKTTFWLNLISCFAALFGFAAQIIEYQFCNREKHGYYTSSNKQ